MVIVGEAITTLPVLAFKEPEGDQEKDVAPLAVKVVLEPEQITVELALTFTVGVGFTLIVIVLVLLQPLVVPVTE